mmetsp:Transcript_8801/g.25978  ORF Transcript_8801/g.25978 Transcript_8801/m.25978 type:complete len:217 (-) Transcript_8801:61-711(-)
MPAIADVSVRRTRVSEPPLARFAARSRSPAKQARRCDSMPSLSRGAPDASPAIFTASVHASSSGAMVSSTSSAWPPSSRTSSAAPTAANIGTSNGAMEPLEAAGEGTAKSSRRAPARCTCAATSGRLDSVPKRMTVSSLREVSACSRASRANVLLPVPRGPQTSSDCPRPIGASASTAVTPVKKPSDSCARWFCTGVDRRRQAMAASANLSLVLSW